jgi:thiamine kinase-like enzyme
LRDLSTGFTDNKVHKNGRSVVKVGKTVSEEYDWYCKFTNKKYIPKIVNFHNGSLTLEFIKRDDDIDLDKIIELIDEYKLYSKLNVLSFDSYVQNIKNHLSHNKKITNGKTLIDKLSQLDISPTFCHGDLSIMNIIPTRLGIKLIDPLYSATKFGSYEIDIAKLCFSFKFYKNDSASFYYVKQKCNIPHIDTLIAAESVRVASYKNEYSFVAENLIRELKTEDGK